MPEVSPSEFTNTQKGRRWASSCAVLGVCVVLALGAVNEAAAASGKRVLIVHSFGTAAPPATTHSTAFEAELTELMGEGVDLDEVSLDHARYADADMQEALVEYLEKRQAKWQPDLVVPIGSPAGVFVAQYRERLFPHTPILYIGMDQRRLPPGTLERNAAFVGENFDLPGFVADMLVIAPDTTNILCVIGTSPVERYWKVAFQQEFGRFTNRLGYTWLDDLPFDQILHRVKRLPPHSFIFFILLMRDAAGVTRDADDALKRMSEVANAPVNSIFDHQLGLGIVGGRLYRAGFEGVEGARIGARILHGESPSNFPPEIVGPIGWQYDWRALRRWKIPESRLPAGSVVKYRVPTTWERYRIWIIAIMSILLIQGVSIAGLVLNQRRTRRAERSLRESEERMKLAASAAELVIWDWDLKCDHVAEQGRKKANGERNSDYTRFLNAVCPQDRDGVAQAMAKAVNGDGSYEHVHRVCSNGLVRWIAGRGRVEFDGEHRPLRMRGIGMDITARKLAEELAKEAAAEAQRSQQELAHMSRVSMLVELAGSLAHELNQPLASVVSNAEAAQRLMKNLPASDEEMREALQDIQEEGQRAGEIIARIRAMVKKDNGTMARQDLNLAVREAVAMTHSALTSRQVKPILQLDPVLPFVNGHGVQLRQVLLNLIMNACDAMSGVAADRRQLTIQSRRVSAGEVEISVADSGPGFAEDVLRHVFEPFRTTKAEGLGLGLTISRSIIRTHGGRLTAANKQGGGAALRFTLPVRNERDV